MNNLSRRDVIKQALACEPVSRIPYNLDFTRDMRALLREHFGREDVDEAVGNYMLQINVGSNAGAEVNRVAAGLITPLGNDHFEDEFGVIWDKRGGDDIGVPVNQVIAAPDADLCPMPDAADQRRWEGYEQIAATAEDRYVLACFSSPLFQRAWFLRGMADFLMDLAANEEFVAALLDKLMNFSLDIVRGVAEHGADGIFFYDDYAQQTGLMFSPTTFRRHFAPRLKAIFTCAREAGLEVFFHSCGNVSSILENLHHAGAHVFNPFQPEGMDVEQVARQFAGRLTFYGGISTQHTLPYGTPDDVRLETAQRIALFREQGGYILSPAHALQRDVPLENVLALLEEVRHPRR